MAADLYSQYDGDDDPTQNYFYLPKEKDMYKFQKAFIQLNQPKINNTQHKSKLRSQPPPRPPKQNDNGGDYCLIKNDTKPVYPKQVCSSRFKRENLQEFPSHRIPNCSSCNVNLVNGEFEVTTHLQTKNSCSDTNTDYRTYSACMKNVVKETDSSITDEQSERLTHTCSTSKGVLCRYLCMGVLALFVPCLMCYGSGRSACGRRNNTSHSSSKLTFQRKNEKLVT